MSTTEPCTPNDFWSDDVAPAAEIPDREERLLAEAGSDLLDSITDPEDLRRRLRLARGAYRTHLAEKDAEIAQALRNVRAAEDEVGRMQDWSNDLAERMPPEFDGDEAQEYLIDNWVTSLITEREAALDSIARAWDEGYRFGRLMQFDADCVDKPKWFRHNSRKSLVANLDSAERSKSNHDNPYRSALRGPEPTEWTSHMPCWQALGQPAECCALNGKGCGCDCTACVKARGAAGPEPTEEA